MSASLLKVEKLQYFSLATFCQIFWVTEETFVVETAVWPSIFLLICSLLLKDLSLFLFTDFKGSNLINIFCYYCSGHKSLPVYHPYCTLYFPCGPLVSVKIFRELKLYV